MNEVAESIKQDIEAVNGVVEACAVECAGLMKRTGVEDSGLRKVCASLDKREDPEYLTEADFEELYSPENVVFVESAEPKRIALRKMNAKLIFAKQEQD